MAGVGSLVVYYYASHIEKTPISGTTTTNSILIYLGRLRFIDIGKNEVKSLFNI